MDRANKSQKARQCCKAGLEFRLGARGFCAELRNSSNEGDNMQKDRSKYTEYLGCLVIVLIVAAFFAWGHYNKARKEELKSEQVAISLAEQKREKEELVQWALKYDAITFDGPAYGEWPNLFTLNLSENLVEKNGRPVMFRGSIIDIYKEDGVYYALYQWWEPWLSGSTYSYANLVCTAEQVEVLRNLTHADLSFNYVIALINDVRKQNFSHGIYDATVLCSGELIDHKVDNRR